MRKIVLIFCFTYERLSQNVGSAFEAGDEQSGSRHTSEVLTQPQTSFDLSVAQKFLVPSFYTQLHFIQAAL